MKNSCLYSSYMRQGLAALLSLVAIEVNLPSGAGLHSSLAIRTAIVAAISKLLTTKKLATLRLLHGTISTIRNQASRVWERILDFFSMALVLANYLLKHRKIRLHC